MVDDPAPTPPPPSIDAAPVASPDRIASLDVLRGVAVLGILVMNIQAFSMPDAAYSNPTAYGDLSGPNRWVWVLSHLFTDQKFLSIFSMLFGAGIVLMAERAEARGWRPAPIHYRRMGWLLLIGLLHGHLLWYGDVLVWYALCGLGVYLFRGLAPRWLIPLGLVTISVGSLLFLLLGWSMQFWPGEVLEQVGAGWQPPAEQIGRNLEIYRGPWPGQLSHRIPLTLAVETVMFALFGLWRAGGLMLIGMALYKLGVLSARRSTSLYVSLVVIGLGLGLPVVGLGIARNFAANWRASWSQFLGSQFNYWGSLGVAAAWIGLVMLACRAGRPRWAMRSLAAVGRMALTNYLMQTVLCTTLFYGHGFGLYGRVERVGQAAIVLAVWALQLAWSPWWLAMFRFGPAEWVWRSLTYLRLQPFRR